MIKPPPHNPRFSVIIPTYNRAQFLPLAIESVLGQTCRDHEAIVIDDGSTDNTRDVLRLYENRVTVLCQENAGPSVARNAGIREARGAWIAFLDSDDEWRRDYLALQTDNIRRWPQGVAHITNALTNRPDGGIDHHFQPKLLRKFRKDEHILVERPFRLIIGHPHWYLQATVMRRDILYRAGLLNPRLTIAEDLDLIARMALQGPFGISRKILVETYRRVEAIKNLGALKLDDRISACEMFEIVYENLGKAGDLIVTEKIALAREISSNRRAMGNHYWKEGSRLQARACYRRAMTTYPSPRSVFKYLASFLPSSAGKLFIRK